jgi:putative FmdB family regulatory protein
MPTYEYECLDCGHHFDAFQHMADEPLSECPECGKKVRRVLSGGYGVIFKGSGFYKNDSRKTDSSGLMGSPKKAKEADSSPCAHCAENKSPAPSPTDTPKKAAS